MASWGRNVDVVLTGTGSIDANTNIVTGANTVFTEEVEVRNVIDLDGEGRFVVLSVVDDENLLVEPIAGDSALDEDILLSEVPKYLSTTQAIEEAVFVTVAEAQDSENRAEGIKTPGWNLVKTIGNNRTSVETLVAMKQTST
jgi:hypothetical protein